jgi:hypothetical protein
MTREQIRYNLGEDEFLKWEARNDAAHDDDEMSDDERDEWERELRAELEREIPTASELKGRI